MNNEGARIKSRKLYPDLKECVLCKSEKNLVRHHLDYNDPRIIMIMCKKCHSIWHRNNKAKNTEEKNYVMYRIYEEDEQAIIKRLVKEVVKTGKSQTKSEVLSKILQEEIKRLK